MLGASDWSEYLAAREFLSSRVSRRSCGGNGSPAGQCVLGTPPAPREMKLCQDPTLTRGELVTGVGRLVVLSAGIRDGARGISSINSDVRVAGAYQPPFGARILPRGARRIPMTTLTVPTPGSTRPRNEVRPPGQSK